MTPVQVGRVLKAVRQQRKLRLVDVARAAGCSASTASRAERGDWERLAYGRIDAIATVLEVRLDLRPRWRGAELDRVLDDGHARLMGLVVGLVERWGWQTRIEVTFSEYGERGSIDLLAWHPATRTLVVFEIKTELGSVEGLLRPLNVKVRLAERIARDQFGWRAARVGCIVVFPEDRAVRRLVDRHATVLVGALPNGSRDVRRWLREPSDVLRGRWFLTNSRAAAAGRETHRQCDAFITLVGWSRDPNGHGYERDRSAEGALAVEVVALGPRCSA